jgi:His/Glu/Gln/Arg/opine family amino acid ABC transporter permease subunit
MFLAMAIGLFLAICQLSSIRPIRYVAILWMEFWRGVPLLVLLIWFFYGVGALLGIDWSPWFAGAVILSLNYGAYLSEIYRAGINAIPTGQRQAAKALGLSNWLVLRLIIVPQAFRITIPPLINNFVGLLKDSSLVSVIGLFDLMRMTQQAVTYTYRPFELYTVATIIYLVMIVAASAFGRLVERQIRIVGLGGVTR